MAGRMRGIRPLLLSALLCAAAVPASAEDWPQRVVRVVVPYAPGGNADTIGRFTAQALTAGIGAQFVVENRPGAGGAIGTEFVAKAAPDGYTLCVCALSQMAPVPLMQKVAYDPLKDFVPVAEIGANGFVITVSPAVPTATLQEFIAYVKARPGQLHYASGGNGTLTQLSAVLFLKQAGLDMVHVPYKGGAGPATAGLMGGETNLMFATAASAMPGIKSGRLKPLAVTSTKRIESLPQVPTVAEAGFADLVAGSWQGIFVPTGTPREVVSRLFPVVTQVMKDADVIARLKNGGAETVTSESPAAFQKFVAAETDRWAKIAIEAGATPD
jgi:tripartite-type tricarboxylate transporter receptor subunit TctC